MLWVLPEWPLNLGLVQAASAHCLEFCSTVKCLVNTVTVLHMVLTNCNSVHHSTAVHPVSVLSACYMHPTPSIARPSWGAGEGAFVAWTALWQLTRVKIMTYAKADEDSHVQAQLHACLQS